MTNVTREDLIEWVHALGILASNMLVKSKEMLMSGDGDKAAFYFAQGLGFYKSAIYVSRQAGVSRPHIKDLEEE